MKNFARSRKLAWAIGALALVLAASAPSQAAEHGGHGFGGDHGAARGHGPEGHSFGDGRFGDHRFGDHRFEDHRFGDHRFEDHRFEGRRFGFFAPVVPYFEPYDYGAASGYWYYCPDYNAYYPDVTSCPQAWVPVPG